MSKDQGELVVMYRDIMLNHLSKREVACVTWVENRGMLDQDKASTLVDSVIAYPFPN